MDESQSPGKTSLPPTPPKRAIEKLRLLTESEPLRTVLEALGHIGLPYLVGGTVRDMILQKEVEDFDLACSQTPDHVMRLLDSKRIRVVETGLKHGTISAIIHGHNIQITTFRKPGHIASQEYSNSIEEDLSARDFTINAIAFSCEKHLLIDPYGGLQDLEAGILKSVKDPYSRFKEDPLRILRMFRFGPAEGREIEAKTLVSAKELASTLHSVSPERIQLELKKILLCPLPGAAFRIMAQIGILAHIIPELLPAVGFEQNSFHTQDVFEHTLSVLQACPEDIILRLAALFHDTGKPHTLSVDKKGERHFYEHEVVSTKITKAVFKRLKFSNEETEVVSKLVRMHMRPLECGPSGVRRLLRDLGPEFKRWREFKIADATPVMPQKEFDAQLARFDIMVEEERVRVPPVLRSGLAIDGNDLIELGCKQGPLLGRRLKELEDLILEDPTLNTKELLLEKAKGMIAQDT